MSPPPPLPSSQLRAGIKLDGGRYTLLRPLGAGGNGVVWLASHASLATEVVVKFPKRWSGASAAEAELFVSEMRRLASLSHLHPHIVNILDAGAYRGRPFFVMQYLANGALEGYCGSARHRLQSTQRRTNATSWIDAIASALDFLHERATIHRDVKPGNMLLDESNGAYLADFGIAVPSDSKSRYRPGELTPREVVTGSLPYLAPELLAGGPASAASDQFALAVSIFEFITGRRPFDGANAEQVAENHRLRMASWQANGPPGMSSGLWRALSPALAPNPTRRYPHCMELARAADGAFQTSIAPTAASSSTLRTGASDSTIPATRGGTQTSLANSPVPSQSAMPPEHQQPRHLTLDRMRHGRRADRENS